MQSPRLADAGSLDVRNISGAYGKEMADLIFRQERVKPLQEIVKGIGVCYTAAVPHGKRISSRPLSGPQRHVSDPQPERPNIAAPYGFYLWFYIRSR